MGPEMGPEVGPLGTDSPGFSQYTESCRMYSMRVHSDRGAPGELSRACRHSL
jgi:hypothetical protein